MTTTYRYDGSDYSTLDAAAEAVRGARGWDEVVTSESYALGMQEGKRGSVYGVSCYESQEACDADETGAHAPRILVVRGDEAWAMGRDA